MLHNDGSVHEYSLFQRVFYLQSENNLVSVHGQNYFVNFFRIYLELVDHTSNSDKLILSDLPDNPRYIYKKTCITGIGIQNWFLSRKLCEESY